MNFVHQSYAVTSGAPQPSGCKCETETFLERKNKKGNMTKVWGLVRCSNKKCVQIAINKNHKSGKYTDQKVTHDIIDTEGGYIHNRDVNAVRNMLSIVESLKITGKRPIEFTRSVVPDKTIIKIIEC